MERFLLSVGRHRFRDGVQGPWRSVGLMLLLAGILLGTLSLVWASTPVEFGYRDFSYPSGTAANSEVTAEKPESKLWWNDGIWWGSLWSTEGNAYHIFRLDTATQSWIDTGTALDDREDSRADTLWDGQHLYVASHIFDDTGGRAAASGQRGELFRYSYDPATDTYILDPGFPVEVTGGKSETLVLEKDSGGQLWVTYVENDQVMVNHSVNGDDLQWATPFVLPVGSPADVDEDDISSIVAYSQHVGVMWSNQKGSNTIYFAVHPVGAPETTWTHVQAYDVSADDHISLKSLEADSAGNVFAAIKTSKSAALIVLLVCENNVYRCKNEDNWSSHTVYDGTHSPTRPFLLIDTSNRELYVFTRNKDENNDSGIYYKRADLDNIQFPTGIGTAFIRSAADPDINDPTSTKQNLSSTTGLVVLASDSRTRYYLHNHLALDGTATQYSVTVNKVGLGNVTLNPPGGIYDEGATVSLTATPGAGWVFSGWSGDLTGTDNPATLTLDADKTVTATFTLVPQYTLTTNSVGSGSVTLDPPGGTYDEGTAVTLTATPSPGWAFSGWSGDLTGAANPATIIMDADKTVTATFVPEYTLTVDVIGSGSVALDPSGGAYADGTVVTLTASASSGWRFGGWSGNLAGADNPATITMDSDKTVTATFIRRHDLTVSTNGSGSVTLDPPGGVYDVGTEVTLTAEADPGWGFSHWSGDLAGTANPANIIIDKDKNVTANFSLPQYTLTVNVVGSGSVTLDPPGGMYDEGTIVYLSAEADPGSSFAGWSGDLFGDNNPASIRIDSDKMVTGTFTLPQYALSVGTAGSGSVTLDPAGGTYDEGTEVTLTATADPGWTFSGWNGDLMGMDNPATLTMDGDKSVVATFVQKEPGIQIDKYASTDSATVGEVVTYTYVVANVGRATLSEVTAQDDHLGSVPLGTSTLSSGQTIVATLPYTVAESDLPGPLASTVVVTGTTPTDTMVTDSATVTITVSLARYNFYLTVVLIPGEAGASPGIERASGLWHQSPAVRHVMTSYYNVSRFRLSDGVAPPTSSPQEGATAQMSKMP